MMKILSTLFGLDSSRHNVRTEIMAGITTFLTMAYILAVNPNIFGVLEGMPRGAVFTTTALASVVATLVMAFYAKKPFGLAPGMGLNAFFVYTVCLTMGYSWQFALTAVFLEGIIFVILTVTKVRQLILNAIPLNLKNAIGGGIGFFIAFIGMQNAGIIVNSDSTLVVLGDISHGPALLALIGLVITAALVALKVRGGILLGIIITTLLGLVIQDPSTGAALTQFSGSPVSMPDSIAPIFLQFEWNRILSADMIIVVLTFLFIDMFDTMGTVIGVSQKAGFVDKDGNVDGIDKVFMADAVGTIVGSALGTSTTTTYVESSSGVAEGGRTGLTAFSTAMCFLLALLLSPIFLAIPSAATAPALIAVGVMMISPIIDIKWGDFTEDVPCFLTIAIMPLAYSISDGILIGVISYVLVNAVSGKLQKISITMWILALLFILKYIFI